MSVKKSWWDEFAARQEQKTREKMARTLEHIDDPTLPRSNSKSDKLKSTLQLGRNKQPHPLPPVQLSVEVTHSSLHNALIETGRYKLVKQRRLGNFVGTLYEVEPEINGPFGGHVHIRMGPLPNGQTQIELVTYARGMSAGFDLHVRNEIRDLVNSFVQGLPAASHPQMQYAPKLPIDQDPDTFSDNFSNGGPSDGMGAAD